MVALRTIAAVAMLAAVALVACGAEPDESVGAPQATEGAAEPEAADTSEPADEAGSPDDSEHATGGAGQLPDTFPETFPLPDWAVIRNSYGVGSAAIVHLAFEDRSLEDVVAFFDEELPAAGWEIVDRQGREQPVAFERLEFTGHGHQGHIRIEADGSDDPGAFLRVEREE